MLTWLIAIILWFQPELRPTECESGDAACIQINEEREREVFEIAAATLESSERENLDPIYVLAVEEKESGWRANPCDHRVRLTRILERIPLGDEGHETIKFRCWRQGDPNGTCQRDAFRIRESGAFLRFDTCRHSEIGHMQVLARSQWGRPGTPIPASHVEDITATANEGRSEFRFSHVFEEPGVSVDGEYVRRCSENRRRRCVRIEDGRVFFTNPPDADETVTMTEVLSENGERYRVQMLNPRFNIALGSRELAYHREHFRGDREQWWRWIGAYNTGTYHGQTSRDYARRILYNYSNYCHALVPTMDGERRLREVWTGCEGAEAAYERERFDAQ